MLYVTSLRGVGRRYLHTAGSLLFVFIRHVKLAVPRQPECLTEPCRRYTRLVHPAATERPPTNYGTQIGLDCVVIAGSTLHLACATVRICTLRRVCRRYPHTVGTAPSSWLELARPLPRRHRPIGGAVAATTEPTPSPPTRRPPGGGRFGKTHLRAGGGSVPDGGFPQQLSSPPAGRKGNGGSRRPSRSWGGGFDGVDAPTHPQKSRCGRGQSTLDRKLLSGLRASAKYPGSS